MNRPRATEPPARETNAAVEDEVTPALGSPGRKRRQTIRVPPDPVPRSEREDTLVDVPPSPYPSIPQDLRGVELKRRGQVSLWDRDTAEVEVEPTPQQRASDPAPMPSIDIATDDGEDKSSPFDIELGFVANGLPDEQPLDADSFPAIHIELPDELLGVARENASTLSSVEPISWPAASEDAKDASPIPNLRQDFSAWQSQEQLSAGVEELSDWRLENHVPSSDEATESPEDDQSQAPGVAEPSRSVAEESEVERLEFSTREIEVAIESSPEELAPGTEPPHEDEDEEESWTVPPDRRALIDTELPPPPEEDELSFAEDLEDLASGSMPFGYVSSPDIDIRDLENVTRPRVHAWWESVFDEWHLRTLGQPTAMQIRRRCDFVEESLDLAAGAKILDLGCGSGLATLELARRGFVCTGMDYSTVMLASARRNADVYQQSVKWVHGDMRELNVQGLYDAVLCTDTTFGYFDDDTNAQVMKRMYNALKSRGLLFLEIVNRDYIIQHQPSMVWYERAGCVCMEDTQFNFISSRLHVKRTIMSEEGDQRETEYSIRLYSLHELGKLLHHVGFRVVEVSGMEATRGVFFGTDSPRILLLCEQRPRSFTSAPPAG